MKLISHGIFRAIFFCNLKFVPGCRTGIHFSRVVLGLLILVLFILITVQVHGNGWEHTVIPFEALNDLQRQDIPMLDVRDTL